jgi:FlaA1/EpsC-like NDP-sugar epimerase
VDVPSPKVLAGRLLARAPIAFEADEQRRLVEGRRVLVTGAGGTIGGEIARQVAAYGAAGLVLVDMNENALYLLYRELQAQSPRLALTAAVADIRDRGRMRQLAREHRPHDVFHAAAHKHVPLLEDAPADAVKNNVVGCLHVASAAEECGAARFVLVSTDKAVRPSSVMGATKRLAETIVAARRGRATRFTSVRFGNVLGSSGSVVPLFAQQIAAGGPVTVTHPEASRHFMTVDEAVALVVDAGLGGYGDLCVPEIDAPTLVLDLARLMIALAAPEADVPIVFTGLRPGEKLHEDLLTADERARSRLVSGRIRVVTGLPAAGDLAARVERLEAAAATDDAEAVVAALREAVPEYEPPASRAGSGCGIVRAGHGIS